MTKLTAQATGAFAIAPTPFHDDGRIDERSIDRLTDFYAEVGCDGVTVLGILGEAPKLDAAEAEQVAIRFVKRAKSMQIIVGVSAPGFASMSSLAKASMDAGAAGVMIAPPPHLRTDDQIVGYFKQANYQKLLAYSQCMRTHGVPNFPDPTFQGGGVQVRFGPGSGINPQSPAFQNAARQCKGVFGGKGGGFAIRIAG